MPLRCRPGANGQSFNSCTFISIFWCKISASVLFIRAYMQHHSKVQLKWPHGWLLPAWTTVGKFLKVWDFSKVQKILRNCFTIRPGYFWYKTVVHGSAIFDANGTNGFAESLTKLVCRYKLCARGDLDDFRFAPVHYDSANCRLITVHYRSLTIF